MVVASPKADVTAALIAAGDASFERLRLLERLLGRVILLVGRLRSFAALRMTERFGRRAALLLRRREVVLDGRAVLAGRSGTSSTCLPAVAGRAPVGLCARLPMAAVGFLAESLALPGDAAGAEDFASRAEDDDEDDGDAAMVVASPKASVKAALIAAGDASFERLRLLERVLGRDADSFAPVAAGAFCFFEFGHRGVSGFEDRRRRWSGGFSAIVEIRE